MSKSKKGWLPRIEILIVLVFFLSFIIWAASKCQATKALYQENDLAEEILDDETEGPVADISTESVAVPPANSSTSPTTASQPGGGTTTQPGTATTPAGTSSRAAPSPTTPAMANADVTRLFVTIGGLNVRTEPRLNAQIVDKLNLDDVVIFMNEVTDTTQKINLGTIVADEPWIKIQTKKGKVGWVYGAGVHYYKGKNPGAID